jgi:DNA-directed RNA polymerase specialized sigma24 family protein
MKRKEFFQIIQPLTQKLYRFAFSLLPDDLQAEQIVIDGLNAYLLRERKSILRKEVNLQSKKELQSLRETYLKNLLYYISDIGLRRANQLTGQLKQGVPAPYKNFYSLEPKVRMIIGLRYEAQFSVEEIVDITQMPKFEVIEKIHNGRYLLLNQQEGKL